MPFTTGGGAELPVEYSGTLTGNPHWATSTYPAINYGTGPDFVQRYYTDYSDAVFLIGGSLGYITVVIADTTAGTGGGGGLVTTQNGASFIRINDGTAGGSLSQVTWDASSVFLAADNTLINTIVGPASASDDGMRVGGVDGVSSRKQATSSDYGSSGTFKVSCAGTRCLVQIDATGQWHEPVGSATPPAVVYDTIETLIFAFKVFARPGAAIELTATWGSLTATATGVVNTLFEIDSGIACNWWTNAIGERGVISAQYRPVSVCNSSVSLSISPSLDVPTYTGTASETEPGGIEPDGTPTVTITQTVHVTASGGGGTATASGIGVRAAAGFAGFFAESWSVAGTIRGVDGVLAIPGLKIITPPQGQQTFNSDGTLIPRVTVADASSGAWSASGANRDYIFECGAYFNGGSATLSPAQPPDVHDIGGVVSFSIDKTTVPAGLRDLISARITLRGPQFTGPTITQAASQQVCNAFTRVATDGAYSLPDSGTAAGLKGQEWTGLCGTAYRCLSVPLMATNLPAGMTSFASPITIMGRTWSKDATGAVIKTTASAQTVKLDTTTFDAGVDGRLETEWTLHRTPDPLPLTTGKFDDPNYKLANITGITIGGIPAPVHSGDPVPTLHVGAIQFVRLDAGNLLTLLPAWNHFTPYYDPPATTSAGDSLGTVNYGFFFDGFCDGIPSSAATHFYQNIPPSGDPTYSEVNIAGLCDAINGVYSGVAHDLPSGGWLASGGQPVIAADSAGFAPLIGGYLNVSSPAAFLGGAGMLYNPTDGTWKLSVELPACPAGQLVFDGYVPSGLAGKVFGFDPPACAILYGAASGMVFTPGGTPVNGATVHAGPSTGTNTGQFGGSTSGANGFFPHTGTPAIPPGAADIAAAVGTSHSGITAISRHISRAVLSVLQSAFRFVEVDSARGWLYCGIDNKVRTYHLSNFMLVMPESAAYGAVDEWIRGRLDIRSGTLILLGQQGAHTFSVCRSGDAGQSIAGGLTVTANSAGIESESERGYFVFLYGDSSDNLMRQLSQDVCQTFAAAAAVNDNTGAAMVGKILDLTRDPRSGAFVMSLLQGGSTSVWLSQDAGMTFTQKLS